MGSRPSSRSVAMQAEQVDAEVLAGPVTTPSSTAGGALQRRRQAGQVLSKVDVLGDLHQNHRQLDDFPSALDPAAGPVGRRNRDSSPSRAPPDGSVSYAGGRSRGVAACGAAAALGASGPISP